MSLERKIGFTNLCRMMLAASLALVFCPYRTAAQSTTPADATPSTAVSPMTTDMNGKAVPDISGFWELHYDSKNVPLAVLTPAAKKDDPEARRQKDMGVLRWCNKTGVPFAMDGPAPLDIRQGRFETSIASQAVSPGRHVYTNGQKHPDLATYDFTVNGHSIGRWDGDTFVVDTIGFSTQGITTIPGGGYRTEDSHLTEHYRLLDGGAELLVTFTWEDAKVFAKPHTYQYVYFRAAPDFYPREYFCDPTDQERTKLLTESPQK